MGRNDDDDLPKPETIWYHFCALNPCAPTSSRHTVLQHTLYHTTIHHIRVAPVFHSALCCIDLSARLDCWTGAPLQPDPFLSLHPPSAAQAPEHLSWPTGTAYAYVEEGGGLRTLRYSSPGAAHRKRKEKREKRAMKKPLLRIPYTAEFAPPPVVPASANTLQGAVTALGEFLTSSIPRRRGFPDRTVVLSGAGLSVASGLADYRGTNGTYRLNKTYRPIYYHEFLASHEARKRYWARSFLGWTTLNKAKPNAGHYAVRDLARYSNVRNVITQNVDSFHPKAHPGIPTLELHGYLRSLVCTSCHHEFPRDAFQEDLARLNPAWAAFLAEAIASGALDTENPDERRARGMRTNPDGDVDLPDAPYTTFRYPACQHCLTTPPPAPDGTPQKVEVDRDGAWAAPSTAGILKPAVIMFGESIPGSVKEAAEKAVDGSGRMLVLATSLATYSAWRLAKRAKDRGMPIAIVNMGGVRGEETFITDLHAGQSGAEGVRIDMTTEQLLPDLVSALRRSAPEESIPNDATHLDSRGAGVFKDMLS